MANGRGLAAKIFSLRKRGSVFPGEVMRSARLAMEGKASGSDIEIMRRALGTSRTGSTAAKRDLRTVSSVAQRAGNYGVLASTAAQGGVAGFAAAGSFINNAFQDIDKIVRSKPFQEALEGAAQKYLGSGVAGTRAGYALRRGLRVAGAGLAYAQAGAGITVGGIRGVEDFTGVVQTERARVAQSESRIAESNSRATRLEKEIASQRALNERSILRKTSEEGARGLFNAFIGADKRKLSAMELRQTAREAGFANSDQVYLLARDRLLREKFGETLGRQARGIDNALGTNFAVDPTEVAEKAQQMIGRAVSLRQQIGDAIKIADTKMASQLIAEAQREIPGQVWRNPGEIWKMQESGRMATRLWSLQNMPRAASRTGE